MNQVDASPVFKCPEIDGVKRALEDYELDHVSDLYTHLIKDTTEPGVFSGFREYSIAVNMHELGCLSGLIEEALMAGATRYNSPDIISGYSSVLDQITDITGIDASYVHRL